MDKFEFIKLMLQNRNLSVNDKKRLVILATNEIVRDDTDSNDSGKTAKQNYNKEGKAISSHRQNIDAPYISPSILQGFLRKYNQNPILKYTCHVIDDEDDIKNIIKACGTEKYELEKHAELIEKSFLELLDDYKKEHPLIIKAKMIPLIRAYITGKDYEGKPTTWTSLNIKTNWKLDELQQWGKEHLHKIPNPAENVANNQQSYGFILNERITSNLSGDSIDNLRDLVTYFKSLFHIRRDNSLRSILVYKNQHNKDVEDGKINISFDSSRFLDNIELLTDVDKLLQGYNRILKICIDNQDKEFGDTTEIELSFYEEDNRTFFCIHHKNTRYGKTVKNALERIGKEQKKLIENQINGLCDLFIEADFGENNYYRINLWDEEPQIKSWEIDKMIGVKYLMRF